MKIIEAPKFTPIMLLIQAAHCEGFRIRSIPIKNKKIIRSPDIIIKITGGAKSNEAND